MTGRHARRRRVRRLSPAVNQYFERYERRTGHKVRAEEVEGDGSCFWHSIAAIKNLRNCNGRGRRYRQRVGHDLRRSFSNLLKLGTPGAFRAGGSSAAKTYFSNRAWAQKMKHWTRFWEARGVPAPNKKAMRRRLENTKEWANATDIMFLMWILECDIIFLDERGGNVYCGVQNEDVLHGGDSTKATPEGMLILWENRTHFMPIVVVRKPRLHGGGASAERVQRSFRPDEDPYAALKRHYAKACTGINFSDVAPTAA